ncbi:hypothetical protein ACWCPQ_14635 [Nocardia sp. NPDC001965]
MDGGYPAGGSAALARLIDQYGEKIVPDLMREYSVDIRDVFVEGSGVTPKWLLTLIIGLPLGSDTKAAMRGGSQFEGWDKDRYLMVGVINAVRELTNKFIQANTPKGKTPKLLDPFPIPHETSTKKQHKPGSFAAIALGHLNRANRKE